jgi:hypothetical protein
MKNLFSFVGAGAVILGVIFGVAIWSGKVSLRIADKDESGANAKDPKTAEASSSAAEEPAGTLEVQASVKAFSLPSSNHVFAKVERGWLFVDGVLIAPLRPGLHTNLRLPPGEHQVKLWLVDSFGGFEFHTLQRSVILEQGQVSRCEATLMESTDRLPSGWDYCSVQSPQTAGLGYVGSASDINSAGEENLVLWDKFQEREDWKAFEKAGEWLNLADSDLRTLWVDLPKNLGGRREIDRDQLDRLRGYMLNEFDASMPQLSIGVVTANTNVDGWQSHLDRVNSARRQCRGVVDRYLTKLAHRLQAIPLNE